MMLRTGYILWIFLSQYAWGKIRNCPEYEDSTVILSIQRNYADVGDVINIVCSVQDQVASSVDITTPSDTITCNKGCEHNPACNFTNVTYCNDTSSGFIVELSVHTVLQEYFGAWHCKYREACVEGDIRKFVPSTNTKLVLPSVIKENISATFKCTATGGDPKPNYIWRINEIVIDVIGSDVPLKLTRHAKKIQCFARQLDYKPVIPSNVMTLNVTYPPLVKINHTSPTFYAVEHTTLSLKCEVTDQGNPSNPTVTWHNINSEILSSTPSFKIENISQQESGKYICQADNGIFVTKGELHVEVQFGPKIIPLQKTVVKENENVTVECTATGNPDAISYKWTKGGSIVQNSKFLQIPNIERRQSGVYTCSATNTLTPSGAEKITTTSMANAEVHVEYSPRGKPRLSTNSQVVSLLDTVQFECNVSDEVDGNPKCDQFHFYHDGKRRWTSNDNVWKLIANSTMYAGNYACRANNYLGQTSMSSFQKINIHAPAVIQQPVTTLLKPIYDDTNSSLLCIASGNNRSIEWTRSGGDINEYFVRLKDELIKGSFPYDQSIALTSVMKRKPSETEATCENIQEINGNYTCIATALVVDRITTDYIKYTVEEQYMPMWKSKHNQTSSEIGKNSTLLHCDVCANPEPYIFHWVFDGRALRDGITNHTYLADVIHFDSVTEADFGIYTCTATNNINMADYNRSFDIALKAAGAPATPYNLRIKDNISSVSMTLTWQPGYNMGYKQYFVIDYKAEYDDDFRRYRNSIPDQMDTMTETLHHLTNESKYNIRMFAFNGFSGGRNFSDAIYIYNKTTVRPEIELGAITIQAGNISVPWNITGEMISRLKLNYKTTQSDDSEYILLRDNIDIKENPILVNNSKLAETEDYYFQLLVYEGELHYTTPGGAESLYLSQRDSVEDKPGFSVAAQAATSVSVLVIVGIAAGIGFFILQRRRSRQKPPNIAGSSDGSLTQNDSTEVVDIDTLYAKPIKKKTRNTGKSHVQTSQQSLPTSLGDNGPDVELYENLPRKLPRVTTPPDNDKDPVYQNLDEFGENPFINVDYPVHDSDKETTTVDEDGLVYIKIPFSQPYSPFVNVEDIHGAWNATAYDTVDWKKTEAYREQLKKRPNPTKGKAVDSKRESKSGSKDKK